MVAGIVEVVGWAVLATGVWLATLSSVSVPELCIAGVASIPCGLLARAGRRALGASWRFRPGWALWVFPVAGAVLAELVALFRLAATHPHEGRFATIESPEEPVDLAAGREALGTLALSATPGTMVADSEPERHRMTLHVLATAGPKVEERIQR